MSEVPSSSVQEKIQQLKFDIERATASGNTWPLIAKAARHLCGFKQKEMAEAVGVSQATISRFESSVSSDDYDPDTSKRIFAFMRSIGIELNESKLQLAAPIGQVLFGPDGIIEAQQQCAKWVASELSHSLEPAVVRMYVRDWADIDDSWHDTADVMARMGAKIRLIIPATGSIGWDLRTFEYRIAQQPSNQSVVVWGDRAAFLQGMVTSIISNPNVAGFARSAFDRHWRVLAGATEDAPA